MNFGKTVDGSKIRQIKPVEVATAKRYIQMDRRNSVTTYEEYKESLFTRVLVFFTLSSIVFEVV